jgi:beta-galactosidase
LLVDAVQAGVGGDTTWNAAGQPLAQYRTTLAPVTFDLVITPLAK